MRQRAPIASRGHGTSTLFITAGWVHPNINLDDPEGDVELEILVGSQKQQVRSCKFSVCLARVETCAYPHCLVCPVLHEIVVVRIMRPHMTSLDVFRLHHPQSHGSRISSCSADPRNKIEWHVIHLCVSAHEKSSPRVTRSSHMHDQVTALTEPDLNRSCHQNP